MLTRANFLYSCGGVLFVLAFGRMVYAAEAAADKVDPQVLQKTIERGVSYLVNEGQAPDGSYSAQISPAVTGICTASLLRSGRSPDDPAVAKSLKYLEGFVQKDGGIYKPDSTVQNYETSIAIMCFTEANKDGRYNKLIKNAENYVKNIQWGGDGTLDKSDIKYGGTATEKAKRAPICPTLASCSMPCSRPGPTPAMKRYNGAVFVSRCQNLESQYNTTPFAAKNPDGGFYYTPADNGTSAIAGKTDDGGLRSYGSMTYAGLKSMIFAGVKKDDPRVKAAVEWIKKNYDIDANPGMGQTGLFYSYHTLAKALSALGSDEFTDAKGVSHRWKAELVSALAKRQGPTALGKLRFAF